ncbi:hypothetical protein [Corynebacterium mayonis]|uniref:hypothetical protein n=1 Tax=Corynebacterium mayonis TaxID=3062461 RepID=UPI0031406A9D
MTARSVVIMPGAPALVAELAPAHGPAEKLRQAVRSAAQGWQVVEIVGSRDPRWLTSHEGSFAAWGAPQVRVGGGSYLPELVARYVLGAVHVLDSRAHIGSLNPDALTVVVADGPAGLSPRAPLAFIDEAFAAHRDIQSFLAGGDLHNPQSLAAAGVVEPELWAELARLNPSKAEVLAVDNSLGVGAYVAAWEV